jgi:acyl-lipid omega-6 desaturase (Delta-12 desaturase)
MIQHDCGHGSFFRRRWANDALGRAIGVLTLTPYAYWRRSHAIHHASSGNLDRRGTGDIDMLTVAEYQACSLLGRCATASCATRSPCWASAPPISSCSTSACRSA